MFRTRPIGGGRAREASYFPGELGRFHRSSYAGRGGTPGHQPDLAGQAGEAQTGSSPTLGPQTHEKANKKYKALAEEEKSVKALTLAKQSLTQQAKDARDEKAREVEAVEAEARITMEGNVQRPPTRSPSPVSPAQRVAGLQSALDDDARESFNQWLDRYSVPAHQSLCLPQAAGPNAGRGTAAGLAWSFAAECNHATYALKGGQPRPRCLGQGSGNDACRDLPRP